MCEGVSYAFTLRRHWAHRMLEVSNYLFQQCESLLQFLSPVKWLGWKNLPMEGQPVDSVHIVICGRKQGLCLWAASQAPGTLKNNAVSNSLTCLGWTCTHWSVKNE